MRLLQAALLFVRRLRSSRYIISLILADRDARANAEQLSNSLSGLETVC